MSKRPEDFWYMHGQAYDLQTFADVHPGGKDQLLSVQGRDITEMVYSMHAVASMDKVKQIMEKYRVPGKKRDQPDVFVWRPDGFYENLRQQVITHLKSLGGNESHKANNMFWIICGLEIILQAILVYWWIFDGSFLSALIAGLICTSLGFMIFHTAGHCGISKNPNVNKFWFNIFANHILGFVNTVWDLHHNYGHHCYTNVYKLDPDVSNAAVFIRKTEAQKLKPQHKYQKYTAYLLLVAFPNQWLGQVIQYALSLRRKRIFGLPMLHKREASTQKMNLFFIQVVIFSLFLIWKQGIFTALVGLYLYSSGVGFAYWACVFPNHDTDMSEQSTIEDVKNSDWGVHQIRHSSNFRIPDWLAYFIGGMNYQVEHHLFPCVHPRHYPQISKIVQEECRKRGVNYHVHSSWFDALRGNFHHLEVMSKDDNNKSE